MRRYHVQRREDYMYYNKMVGYATKLSAMLKKMDVADAVRIDVTQQLLNQLYDTGVIQAKTSLSAVDGLTASAFCRRRLPVVLVHKKFCETIREAVQFVEQGRT
jgi:U3 small nucleolar ribonucleoprotein protein IMP3